MIGFHTTAPAQGLSRRRALSLFGRNAVAACAAAGLPGLRDSAAGEALQTLKAGAAAKGLLYGANSEIAFPEGPEAYRTLFFEQCALYAPGLPWSWGAKAAAAAEDVGVDADGIAMALGQGLKLTGAHLLWHEYTPKWFLGLSKADAVAAAKARIERMTRHYAGQVFAWNVVNEALDPYDGRADGLQRSALLEQLGPDFITTAFQLARAGDRDALLAYNDYDLELDIPEHEARRGALLNLVDRLLAAQAPIQAVGIQSHLFNFPDRFDETRFRRFLREIASRGLKIIISELDVRDTDLPADVAVRDRAVADVYARYLAVCLDETAVAAVVTWGLTDRYTWLVAENDKRFVRRDGLPERPLPFDADFRPKPAFAAIMNAFDHAPSR